MARRTRDHVFAFCGAAGAGKDSLANHLRDAYGFKTAGMADALKALCADQFGWDEEKLFGAGSQAYKEAESHVDAATGRSWSRREVLQFVGTECFRAIDRAHWTKKAIQAAREKLAVLRVVGPVAGIAFVDVRFVNEVELLREAFGDDLVVVRVEKIEDPRPTSFLERARAFLGLGPKQHSSEIEWRRIPADHELAAHFGELPLLYARLDEIAAERGLKKLAKKKAPRRRAED